MVTLIGGRQYFSFVVTIFQRDDAGVIQPEAGHILEGLSPLTRRRVFSLLRCVDITNEDAVKYALTLRSRGSARPVTILTFSARVCMCA